jgi:hypothetical protein
MRRWGQQKKHIEDSVRDKESEELGETAVLQSLGPVASKPEKVRYSWYGMG